MHSLPYVLSAFGFLVSLCELCQLSMVLRKEQMCKVSLHLTRPHSPRFQQYRHFSPSFAMLGCLGMTVYLAGSKATLTDVLVCSHKFETITPMSYICTGCLKKRSNFWKHLSRTCKLLYELLLKVLLLLLCIVRVKLKTHLFREHYFF